MRESSNNSLATSTNIRFGSTTFPDLWWNVTQVEIPTISMDIVKQNTRPGAQSGIAADTCIYTDLNVELNIDSKWETYKEVYDYFLSGLNVETAKFASKSFEMWVEFVDGKGNTQQKFWFHGCRLQEFGGAIATPNDTEETNQTLSLSFSILYFTHGTSGNTILAD